MRVAYLLLLAAAIAGCGSATLTPRPASTATPASSPSGSAATASSDRPSAIVGTWTRTQSCEDQLAAFADAGLLDKAQEWVTANWVGEHAAATDGKFCEGSAPPREHSHFFTSDGTFGSLDEHGSQVDDGRYVLSGADMIQFPDGEVDANDPVVLYSLDGDAATFTVTLPDPCADACRDAYAWALSAFYASDPWIRQPDQ